MPAGEKERIPTLPEDYIVSQEVEEILKMVVHTPARLFMMTGKLELEKPQMPG